MTAEDLGDLRELYRQGLFLQAFERAPRPLPEWPGTDGQILAGRMAAVLGAPRLSDALLLKAYRRDPADLRAFYYHAKAVLNTRGPAEAHAVLRQRQGDAGGDDATAALLESIEVRIFGLYRDFDRAWQHLHRAEALRPDDAWIAIERAILLEREDRYEEGLQAARRSLELRPGYGPAILSVAHMLQLLDHETEAIALLEEAVRQTENAGLVAQLALLQLEVPAPDKAWESLARFEQLSPLLEAAGRSWLAARRSDAAYHRGDREEARRQALLAGEPFYDQLARHLAEHPEPGERVLLAVPFLRQNHRTCGPATLSMLGRYFERPTDHLRVAEQICYGGTTEYSERRWALQENFHPREFTLNTRDASALLGRGIPFAVSTVESTSAHMQVICGHDAGRGVFLVRDPYRRNIHEFRTEEFLERYRSSGPRALVLFPDAAAAEGLELLDQDLYDVYFRMQDALVRHATQEAYELYQQLARLDRDHRLTVQARLALSAYEDDAVGVLSCLDRLLEAHPACSRLRFRKLACLTELGLRDARVELLTELVSRPDCDPVFLYQLAQELSSDGRQSRRCRKLLRRALRRMPLDPGSLYLLGNWQWNEGQLEAATEQYRAAACLDQTSELYAQTYFGACRSRLRPEEAVEFLRHRDERFRRQSSQPARTLFWALDQLDRTAEGLQVLGQAMDARPDDPELLLFAAEAHSRLGQGEAAREFLERARGKGRETSWRRVAARLAAAEGDSREALVAWRRVLLSEPFDLVAHEQVARLLEGLEGRARALEHLRESAEAFVFHSGLQRLAVKWLAKDHPKETEKLLQMVLERNPTDAWAHRELALVLASLRRLDEARDAAQLACHLEPANPAGHGILGHLHRFAGRSGEARAELREAIQRSVDYRFAISLLLRLCEDHEERLRELDYVRTQLFEQVSQGEGVLAYHEEAGRSMDAATLLESLRELQSARPDLPQTWSVLIQQLAAVGRGDEARELAERATQRFPLVARLWLDRARVHAAAGDPDGELEFLERSLRLSPTLTEGLRELARNLAVRGENERALQALQQAVRRNPGDAMARGWLADYLLGTGEHERALEQLQKAVALDPGFEWAWERLVECGDALGRPERVEQVLRRLVERHPEQARSWLLLARHLDAPQHRDERLRALDRALAMNPGLTAAYDLKAALLVEGQQFAAARRLLQGFPAEGALPTVLRARLAWVNAREGDLDEAIRGLQSALEADPTYFPGWAMLADWLEAAGRAEEYAAAAEEMIRIAPEEPMSWGYLGDARRSGGEIAAACEAFERALELQPDYGFAAWQLFDLLQERNEEARAREVILRVPRGAGGAEVSLRRLRLAVDARGNGEVTDAWCELLESADVNTALLRSGLRVLEAVCRLDALEERPEIAAGSLLCLAEALRFHKHELAATISRHAVSRGVGPVDAHRVWLLVDTYMGPRGATSSEVLDGVEASALSLPYRALLESLRVGFLAREGTGPAEQEWESTCETLELVRSLVQQGELPELFGLLRQVSRDLAMVAPLWRPRWWCYRFRRGLRHPPHEAAWGEASR